MLNNGLLNIKVRPRKMIIDYDHVHIGPCGTTQLPVRISNKWFS